MSATQTQGIKPEHCPDPSCVVKVGHGRGFVIEHAHAVKVPIGSRLTRRGRPTFSGFRWRTISRRFIGTAAHCLPRLPRAPGCWGEDRIYPKLLGKLHDAETSISADCIFADPIADLALLGSLDDQELYDEAAAFEDFVEA